RLHRGGDRRRPGQVAALGAALLDQGSSLARRGDDTVNETPPSGRRQIDALFEAALDLPPAERASFLDREPPPEAVRKAVDRLLERAEEGGAGPTLGGPILRQVAADLAPEEPAAPLAAGERLGPYSIVHELGRGGMARVYLAERADGLFEQ